MKVSKESEHVMCQYSNGRLSHFCLAPSVSRIKARSLLQYAGLSPNTIEGQTQREGKILERQGGTIVCSTYKS